jgi:hypothetical protein
MIDANCAVVGNRALYVDDAMFFKLVQDKGEEMDDQTREKFAKGSRKLAVARKIHFQGRLYPILYQLASLLLDKMQGNPRLFPRLPTSKNNKTKTVHAIGKNIAAKRYSQARSNIDPLPPGEVDSNLANAAEYSAQEDLFILSQKEVIYACHLHYGKITDSKKITLDDKDRAVGIAMTDSHVRELLPDMLGRTRGGTRQEMEAKLQGFNLLHAKFIDREVVVHLPEMWDDPDTASKIDAKLGGPGIFKEYVQFNPNNESRIELGWTVAEVTAIFDKVAKEYHKMMEIYMKGTGGGPGADENFHNWMERDDMCVVT